MSVHTTAGDEYQLTEPSEQELFSVLEKSIGSERAQKTLTEARRSCNLNGRNDLISLKAIANWLASQKGTLSITGQSMMIRIRCYTVIHNMGKSK